MVSTTPLKPPYVTRSLRSPPNGVIELGKTHTGTKLIDNVHCNLSKSSLDRRVGIRPWQYVTTDIYGLDSNSKNTVLVTTAWKLVNHTSDNTTHFRSSPPKYRPRLRHANALDLRHGGCYRFFFFFLSNLWVSVVGEFFRCSFRPFRPLTIYITVGGDAFTLIHYSVRWSEDKTKINIRIYEKEKTRWHSARSWIIHEQRDFHVNEIRNSQTGD